MGFDVATGADSGDNYRRTPRKRERPPTTSVAGDVTKKKKVDLSKVIPPPEITTSNLLGRQLDFQAWRANDGDDEDIDDGMREGTDFRRMRGNFGEVLVPTTQEEDTQEVTYTEETEEQTLSPDQKKIQLQALLANYPQLRPYYKYNLHLEGKSDLSYRLVHTPLMFESRCGSCVDHGHQCYLKRNDPEVRCFACRRYGGRCVFKNLHGPILSSDEARSNCGRCLAQFPYDVGNLLLAPTEAIVQMSLHQLPNFHRVNIGKSYIAQPPASKVHSRDIPCDTPEASLQEQPIRDPPSEKQDTHPPAIVENSSPLVPRSSSLLQIRSPSLGSWSKYELRLGKPDFSTQDFGEHLCSPLDAIESRPVLNQNTLDPLSKAQETQSPVLVVDLSPRIRSPSPGFWSKYESICDAPDLSNQYFGIPLRNPWDTSESHSDLSQSSDSATNDDKYSQTTSVILPDAEPCIKPRAKTARVRAQLEKPPIPVSKIEPSAVTTAGIHAGSTHHKSLRMAIEEAERSEMEYLEYFQNGLKGQKYCCQYPYNKPHYNPWGS